MTRVAAIVPSLRNKKSPDVTDMVVGAILSKHVAWKQMEPRAHLSRAEREAASRARQQRRNA